MDGGHKSWGMNLKFKCRDGTKIKVGDKSRWNVARNLKFFKKNIPDATWCPTTVNKSNWANHEQYGDQFKVSYSSCKFGT